MSEFIFCKEYDGESIVDLDRDIFEALNESNVPQDKYGFPEGTFTVTIEWKE